MNSASDRIRGCLSAPTLHSTRKTSEKRVSSVTFDIPSRARKEPSARGRKFAAQAQSVPHRLLPGRQDMSRDNFDFSGFRLAGAPVTP